ncbi:MAG: hypothetical protein MPK62_03825, partial [Alphaproteobacteria bacterium]|nr:hypothetical protein [Alphaproteobacteria bacterium]
MESLIRSKVMDNYEQQKREATRLAQHGLYNPAEEHDSCGVGFIAAINGKPSRQVVTTAINALRAVWHLSLIHI